jgi:integrase
VHVPSAHGLRATYITLARAGGAELEAIADDVGHADIRMTRRYLDRSRRKANNSALRIPVDFGARKHVGRRFEVRRRLAKKLFSRVSAHHAEPGG